MHLIVIKHSLSIIVGSAQSNGESLKHVPGLLENIYFSLQYLIALYFFQGLIIAYTPFPNRISLCFLCIINPLERVDLIPHLNIVFLRESFLANPFSFFSSS